MKTITNDFYLLVEMFTQQDGGKFIDFKINGDIRAYSSLRTARRLRTYYTRRKQYHTVKNTEFVILKVKYDPDNYEVIE